MEMATKAEYKELEYYLQQTQNKIGNALSNLAVEYPQVPSPTSASTGNLCVGTFLTKQNIVTDDSNANPLQHDDLTAVNNNQNTSVPDFVSIFAANNLVPDDLLLDGYDGTCDKEKWHFTLPANFSRKKSPPERPRTLTPPCTQSGKKRFRKRDWKFYVHGKYKTLIPVQQKHEYGFFPIKDDNVDNYKPEDQIPKRYRTEIVLLDKLDSKLGNLNDSNHDIRGNINKKTSELQLNISHNSISVCNNSSSYDNSDKQSQLQTETVDSSTTTSVSGENTPTNSTKDIIINTLETNLVNNTRSSNVINNEEVVRNQSGIPLKSSNKVKGPELKEVSSIIMNIKDCNTSYSAFQPVQGNNVNQVGEMDAFSSKLVGLKSPVLRRPAMPVLISHSVQHEGTMTQLSTESSTSDAYYRESSLSPSSPDYKGRPTIILPPPPALDKHEARLKASGRSSSASRSKSGDRKNKKRSKSKDGKINKRDPSPSKTERSHEGKVSTATQTHKSTKIYKASTKSTDHKLDNKKSDHTKNVTSGSNVVNCDSFGNSNTYSVSDLPMPVSKRAAMESSTSSDESGDYKKVNITALRERFMQNREKSKHSHKNNNKEPKDKKIDSKNLSRSKGTHTSSASNEINGPISRDIPLQADSNKFTPVDKTEPFDNDILENDMYNFEDSRDTTPVNGIEDQCVPEECDYCEIMQSTGQHCQFPHTEEYFCQDSECQQLNQIKCLNEAANCNLLLQEQPQQQQSIIQTIDCSVRKEDHDNSMSNNRPLCAACISKYETTVDDSNDAVIIPSREQRRMLTKPLMPAIAEDVQKSSESDTETLGSNVTIDETGVIVVSTTVQSKINEADKAKLFIKQQVGSAVKDMSDSHCNNNVSGISLVATSCILGSGPRSPGVQSTFSLQSQSSVNSITSQNSDTSGDPQNENSLSLLDRLHIKYYPDQYKVTKVRSESSVSSSQMWSSSSETVNVEKPVSPLPKNATVHKKPSLNVLSSGVTSPKSTLSPRLRRSSPRQPEKGEEGKPPRSPTSLASKTDKLSEKGQDDSQNLKEQEDEATQEIEAVEACKWLRAAGFPQYAQMYEDQQFPIDIASVEKDHDFLDKDSIQSIFRRLNTLNKCARMKIEAPPRKNNDESDEEEQCALSDKWKYQRSSRRWSRKDLDLSDLTTPTTTGDNNVPTNTSKVPVKSCSSQDSLLTDNESPSHYEDSPVPSKRTTLGAKKSVPDTVQVHISNVTHKESKPVINLFDNRDRARSLNKPIGSMVNGLTMSREGSASPNLRRVQSEKVHGPKSFFKRIESLKTKKSNKKIRYPPGTKLEIGQPVVVNTDDMKERMQRLGCKDISPMSEETQQLTSDLSNSFATDSDKSPVLSTGRQNLEDCQSSVTGSEESLHKSSVSSLVKKKSVPTVAPEVQNNNSEFQSNFNSNDNASDLDRVVFSLENSEAPTGISGFPKVVPNGYIEMENGSRLNYRTGSFNLGSHSDDYREYLQSNSNTYVRAVSEDREAPGVSRRIQHSNPEYRMSIYDNLGPDVDPQLELDKILQDLMENINGLNESLGDSESLLELGTFGLKGYVPESASTLTPNQDEPLTKLQKQRDAENKDGSIPIDTSDHHVCNGDKLVDLTVTSSNVGFPQHQQSDSSSVVNTKSVKSVDNLKTNNKIGNNNSSSNTVRDKVDKKYGNVNTSHQNKLQTLSNQSQQHHHHHSQQQQQQRHLSVDSHQDDCVSSTVMDSRNIPSTSSSNSSQSQHHHHTDQEVDSELEDLAVDGEEEEEEEDDEQAEVQSNSSHDSTCSHHEESDGETPGSREDESSDQPEGRERRDSGVGSSLTRAPSDRRRHRIRWHSFVKSHRPSLNSENLQLSHMSAGQLMVLRKLCLLKVTGLMEKYSPANRSGWNWAMPKFIKRFKAPDYKDKNVFGVPLLVILQRTGQPLPQCMLYAMRCLRRTAKDAVGIFRKSGVRSRIQKLRDDIEAEPGNVIVESIDFESLQPYDVADLIKQYFRELPECLLTNKLSETFISIFTHVPCDERLEALQCTVMLLPDENREVLQSLLLFLSDMASHSHHNQMTASNLAVCFAPSLFHMFGQRSNPGGSPKRGRKNTGIPDQKELQEQKAAHECLTTMITECKKLFMVPEELLSKCRFSYIEQGDPVPLEELGKKRSSEDSSADHTAYIESCIQGLLKESREKFKGWVAVPSPTNVDLCYKKVGDGHPLRLWKCAVDVEAPPEEVLNRVLRERHMWDVDLMKWRVVEKLDAQTEVFQYILNSMAPHPTRDFCELRSWRTQLPKGACVLVSTSVEHQDGSLLGCIRAVILASRYLIEPCGAGKSRLTHICRIDIRGHTPEWYNKAHGHVCATFMARIRDSFKQTLNSANGPETKI